MKFLLTNDDGIQAEGLRRLAEMASQLGEVTIIAPDQECSAMSQRITLRDSMALKKVDYPIPNVTAYSLHGTPADCIKVALHYLKLRPDYVFSGMNHGFNMGYDIAYSGTCSAAFEAVMNGIPAIAFSRDLGENYEVVDTYLQDMTQILLVKAPLKNGIWNVNFPSCPLEECNGYLLDVSVGKVQFYNDHFDEVESPDSNTVILKSHGYASDPELMPEGSDVWGLTHNYVTISSVKCDVLN
ncbi:MAG: 5'/3'-nucleotidase SurE [Lachnospiraceae bacterium]|nr:5'/3'-nucleotidase SurE [Lachnospiraceae bacterium]